MSKTNKTAARTRRTAAIARQEAALDGAPAAWSLWTPNATPVLPVDDAYRALARNVVRLADWRIEGERQDAARAELDAEVDPAVAAWMTQREVDAAEQAPIERVVLDGCSVQAPSQWRGRLFLAAMVTGLALWALHTVM